MYDSLFQEIDRELDWLVTTHDKSAAGRIKKLLAELKTNVNVPIETMRFSQVTIGDVPAEVDPVVEAQRARAAAARAAKAEKAKAKAEPATE